MTILFGSLRRSFVVSGATTTLLLAIVAAIGIWATTSLGASIRRAQIASDALRSHMTADMMHDALRADVLAAIEAGSRNLDQSSLLADLDTHVASLRQSLTEIRALPLPAELKEASDAVGGPLEAYVAMAEKLVPLAVENVGLARREVPRFMSAFRALEERMVTAGDLIEKHGAESAAANVALADTAASAMILALVAGVAATLVATVLIGRAIAPPIVALTDVMARLAEGDTTVEPPATARRDEIGAMARAVDVFKRNAIEMGRLEAEQARLKATTEESRKAEMRRLADRFEAEVMGVVAVVSASAGELRRNAEAMRAAADQTSGSSTAVAAAAEQATVNVRSVAEAASQLSSSIREIAQQVGSASGATATASDQAAGAVDLADRLAGAVIRIGEAVTLIGDVSAQTNLLALNATIEAARAGESGRGFAVVANEVKLLAAQTAKATQEINGHLDDVRNATGEMVKAIGLIDSSIRDVDAISSTIAAAVEEQGAATEDIARNMDEASGGTRDVTENIFSVGRAAERTGRTSDEIVGASGELARQAESLKTQMASFIAHIRAA
ncbi:methyl-accepting chemotaxis protein [Methylopila henanensis]|uniref:Methyl-accepting chemotaxis protein n=1 Tax=Methylopila henanensis TaxID=873516 RepID=A0ABW4K938_9HYPH